MNTKHAPASRPLLPRAGCAGFKAACSGLSTSKKSTQAGPSCDPTSTSASTFTVKHLAPEMEGNALSSTKQRHISNEVCQVHLLWPGRRKDACTCLRVCAGVCVHKPMCAWLQTHSDFPAAELRCRRTHTRTSTPHTMYRALSTDGHRLNKGLRSNASSNACNSPESLLSPPHR